MGGQEMNLLALQNSRAPLKSLLVLTMISVQLWLSFSFFPSLTDSPLAMDVIRDNSPTDEKNDSLKQRLNLDLDTLRQLPTVDERIDRFHQIASNHTIKIKKINYLRVNMPGDLMRTEMQAELSGSYPSIRNFLRNIEAKDPAIAIDSVAFSRDAVNAEVRVQIKFLAYSATIPKTHQVNRHERG
jgi:Type II secretion system (T2SS), protein M subtype b